MINSDATSYQIEFPVMIQGSRKRKLTIPVRSAVDEPCPPQHPRLEENNPDQQSLMAEKGSHGQVVNKDNMEQSVFPTNYPGEAEAIDFSITKDGDLEHPAASTSMGMGEDSPTMETFFDFIGETAAGLEAISNEGESNAEPGKMNSNSDADKSSEKQQESQDKLDHIVENYFVGYESGSGCGSKTCLMDGYYKEHYHCKQCEKILIRRDEMLRHCKWHRKCEESIAHGFIRFSPTEDCSRAFVDCPHNFKNTHYHCFQPNCSKVYLSTSDVQVHSNLHRKDTAILQEGFRRFRSQDDCQQPNCLFYQQHTTHFHCIRPSCNFTFKNRSEIEKHKSYHLKDEQLKKDGFKKFMKYEHCAFSDCRYSKISNHIHCIRKGCSYVLHSMSQLFSHKRKHERKEIETLQKNARLIGVTLSPKALIERFDTVNPLSMSSSSLHSDDSLSTPEPPFTEEQMFGPADEIDTEPKKLSQEGTAFVEDIVKEEPSSKSALENDQQETEDDPSLQPTSSDIVTNADPDSDKSTSFGKRYTANDPCIAQCPLLYKDHYHCAIEGCTAVHRNKFSQKEHFKFHEKEELNSQLFFRTVDEKPCPDDGCDLNELHYHCKRPGCIAVVKASDPPFSRLKHNSQHLANIEANRLQSNANATPTMPPRKRGRPPKWAPSLIPVVPRPVVSYGESKAGFKEYREGIRCHDELCIFSGRQHYHCTRDRCHSATDRKDMLELHVRDFHSYIDIKEGFEFFDRDVSCRRASCNNNATSRHYHCTHAKCDYAFVRYSTMQQHILKHQDFVIPSGGEKPLFGSNSAAIADVKPEPVTLIIDASRNTENMGKLKKLYKLCSFQTAFLKHLISLDEVPPSLDELMEQLIMPPSSHDWFNLMIAMLRDQNIVHKIPGLDKFAQLSNALPLPTEPLSGAPPPPAVSVKTPPPAHMKTSPATDDALDLSKKSFGSQPTSIERNLAVSEASNTNVKSQTQMAVNQLAMNLCMAQALFSQSTLASQAALLKTQHTQQQPSMDNLVSTVQMLLGGQSKADQHQDNVNNLFSVAPPGLGINPAIASALDPSSPQPLVHFGNCGRPFCKLKRRQHYHCVECNQAFSELGKLSAHVNRHKLPAARPSSLLDQQIAATAEAELALDEANNNTVDSTFTSAPPSNGLSPQLMAAAVAANATSGDCSDTESMSTGYADENLTEDPLLSQAPDVKRFKMMGTTEDDVIEGFAKFRTTEDCGQSGCRYRRTSTHFHCTNARCGFGFSDRTRALQHKLRHERLKVIMADDFLHFRSGKSCEFAGCVMSVKQTHFHCLHCDFICTDSARVTAHRKRHVKMANIQAHGFRKIGSGEACTIVDCSMRTMHYHCIQPGCRFIATGPTQMKPHAMKHSSTSMQRQYNTSAASMPPPPSLDSEEGLQPHLPQSSLS